MLFNLALAFLLAAYIFLCSIFWTGWIAALGVAATVVLVPVAILAVVAILGWAWIWAYTRLHKTEASAA